MSRAPTGACNSETVASLIEHLGLLQLDPISVVERAHDHILWTRCNQYRPSHLNTLMQKQRGVFEHFSHDACLLPMSTLPYWKRQFARQAARYDQTEWGKKLLGKIKPSALIEKIAQDGPLCSKDFKEHRLANPASGEIWSKPAHKVILDYLWLKGDLAVSHRKKFNKFYDIASNVYPETLHKTNLSAKTQIDWLCKSALENQGIATTGEIMRFWEACDLNEVKQWAEKNSNLGIAVEIESSEGAVTDSIASISLEDILASPPEPTSRLRIINPFDPAIRDRNRLQRLFGFDYRIEMYTPAEKRQYGYYVYPILEFDRFIGRIEVRHDRKSQTLLAENIWLEKGVKLGKGRRSQLGSELERMSRFTGADTLDIKF